MPLSLLFFISGGVASGGDFAQGKTRTGTHEAIVFGVCTILPYVVAGCLQMMGCAPSSLRFYLRQLERMSEQERTFLEQLKVLGSLDRDLINHADIHVFRDANGFHTQIDGLLKQMIHAHAVGNHELEAVVIDPSN